jgi:hypothetical protein
MIDCYRAENLRKFRVMWLMDSPGLPLSETGAKDGFNPPRSGCTRRSMKKADVLLGESSAILDCVEVTMKGGQR